MQYRSPDQADELLLKEYVQEHHSAGETGISASLGLSSMDYSDWLNRIHRNESAGNAEWGKSVLLLCFQEDRLIGLLSIRYSLPAELSEKFGDIGYGVRPSERNKGYATQMLRHALEVSRKYGKKTVILGCYKDNPASAAVIRKCGGVLICENENYRPGRISQYYSIDLA